MKTHAFVLLAAVVFPLTACADDSKTYLDPEKAGPAYEIQGEYLGEIDGEEPTSRWGAQVIALGDGKFRLV
ncbi:MAG: 3-keto-disaccharide hydrolase, partial [Planctomycetota bacterium]